jgi:uncharacterized protein YxeA
MVSLWIMKNQKLEEEKDYRFVEIGNDIIGVELLTGDFSGVIYHYGMVKFEEQGEGAVLNFNFTIIDTAGRYLEDLNNNQELFKIMGDILTDVLISQKGFDEKNRRDNTEEFDI